MEERKNKGDFQRPDSDETFAMKRRRFTNTALPVFSGAECWFQHFHIVQAIVKSNGWSEETAALQLFAHLKGEAPKVALLLLRERRESWTGLVKGLSAYYRSPGKLAVLRRRFESAFRRPVLDPATLVTELGILAIQGFEDMNEQARDIMIRDKFIAGQRQCALRRQLDGFAQDTPIGEIVDSCRVWESHLDPERIADGNHDSDVEHQSGDFRTREQLKPLVNVQSNIVATNEQDPMVGIGEDHSVIELLVNLLQPTQKEIPNEDRVNRPTAVGPVCFSCICEGHGINRCPQMNVAFPFLPSGWSVNMNNGQYRATRIKTKSTDYPGNEEWSGRGGQPPGPSKVKAPLTLVGGFVRPSNGIPSGRYRRDVTKAATGRQIARNSQPWEGRQLQSGIQRNRTIRPVQVPQIWTGCRRVPRRRFSGNQRGGCGRLRKCGLLLTRTLSNRYGESRRR